MSKPGESGTILQVTSDHLPRRTMNVIVREHGEIEIQLLGRDGVLRKVDPVVIPEMLELLRECVTEGYMSELVAHRVVSGLRAKDEQECFARMQDLLSRIDGE